MNRINSLVFNQSRLFEPTVGPLGTLLNAIELISRLRHAHAVRRSVTIRLAPQFTKASRHLASPSVLTSAVGGSLHYVELLQLVATREEWGGN